MSDTEQLTEAQVEEDASSSAPTLPDLPPANRGLDDQAWQRLLARIKDGECTPIIGSGACTAPPFGYDVTQWNSEISYPQSEQLAQEWATKYEYPLDYASHGLKTRLTGLRMSIANLLDSPTLNETDRSAVAGLLEQMETLKLSSVTDEAKKLERVAQFLSIDDDGFANPMFVKKEFANLFEALPHPRFDEIRNEPHRVLAKLPFPVYLTSNFDDWMEQALKHENKEPCIAVCPWNKHIKEVPTVDPEAHYTQWSPLVYHFHGRTPYAESAVVTEDDYFEFLINIAQNNKLLAHRVDRAIGGGSLLFLGYTLSDWHFLVLFRLLANNLRENPRNHVAVQLAPSDGDGSARYQRAVKYLSSYFRHLNVRVYWGTCQEFCHELRERWITFSR
jgi:SIR2-like domain